MPGWTSCLLLIRQQARKELNVGDFFGKKEGDNPHMWYNPDYVKSIVGKIRDDLKAIDPADATAFDQSAQQYLDTGLKQYNSSDSGHQSKIQRDASRSY